MNVTWETKFVYKFGQDVKLLDSTWENDVLLMNRM
jgi:hypothetical protein